MHFNLNGLALPIALRPATALTDEELIRFSEENRLYKIERNREGELIVMTPVGGIGSTHEAFVSYTLYAWTERDGTGVTFAPNAGFNLPDGSCLAPDAAWLSLPRWNALTLAQQKGFPPLCPEFIVEVRSQSDSRSLLEAKMQLWIENGAELAWLIDPIAADAILYTPGMPPQVLVRPEIISGTGPVAGFELNATRLWPPA